MTATKKRKLRSGSGNDYDSRTWKALAFAPPSPAPVQMLPITFTPPFAAPKPTRQEIATVVCQAIRAAGLRPAMCDECSSLHLNAAGDRPIRPDELTPSVRRACRLMPQEIISAWQDAV